MIAQIDKKYFTTRPYKVYTRLVGYIFFEGRPITTKGQWINPYLIKFYSFIRKIPQLKKIVKPTFILGTGRSGTTILGTILSVHKEVGYLNEPKALWHKIHPNEDLIGTYSLKRANYYLSSKDVSYQSKTYAHKLYGAYLRLSLSSRVVDKYPELIFRIPFILEIFPDAKFLFLVRNGWNTSHSIDLWSKRFGGKTNEKEHDWWGIDNRKWHLLLEQVIPKHEDLKVFADDMKLWTNQRDMAAVEWIVTMREGLKLKELYPDNIYRINYEEMCNNTYFILKEVIDFLELDDSDETFFTYAESVLHQSNNKKAYTLHPSITKPFLQTMALCNYE